MTDRIALSETRESITRTFRRLEAATLDGDAPHISLYAREAVTHIENLKVSGIAVERALGCVLEAVTELPGSHVDFDAIRKAFGDYFGNLPALIKLQPHEIIKY